MPFDSLYELLMEKLRELYHAELQLQNALPLMGAFASTPALKESLESHLADTENQISRLEQAFAELGVASRGKPCKGMRGLLEEVTDVMAEEGEEAILDAALIGVAQRIEYYEMAAYGSAASYAELLGETQVAKLLRLSLDEENATALRLSEIAERDVNAMAVVAGTGDELGT